MKRLLWLCLLLLPLILAAESFVVELPAPEYITEDALMRAGYGFVSAPGRLRLPYKQVNILLPAGSEIISSKTSFTPLYRLSGEAPEVNPGYISSEGVLMATGSFDPQEQVQYLGLKRWGDLHYASYRVLPASYRGGTWEWHASIRIELDYRVGQVSRAVLPPTYSDPSFFANPTALSRLYQASSHRNETYLIISTPALINAAQSLVNYRQASFDILSQSIDTILSSYPGASDAEKLRNYLVEAYYNTPFKYLLLIGDVDTVPTAYLTPQPNAYETVASDYYYSDLTSIWDTDSDGKLGEYYAVEGEEDWLVDYTPECFVGRISTNNAAEVTAICQRIVAFENSTADWKQNALLPAAYLNYQNEPLDNIPLTDGAEFMEYVQSSAITYMTGTTLYEQTGHLPSYPSHYPLDYDQLKNLLSTQSWGVVNWSAHGSPTSSSRKVWMNDDNGNDNPEEYEMEWLGLVNRASFDDLQNTDGTVLFAASCNNGMMDYNHTCLGEYSLIKKTVGTIAATRTGWYKIGWQNPGWGGLSSYNFHWLENYVANQMSVGQALAYTNLWHTRAYLFGDPVDDGGIIYPELQNVYTYTLFGDPAVGDNGLEIANGRSYYILEPSGDEGIRLQNALHEVDPGCTVVHSNVLIPIGYYNPEGYLDQFDAVFCLMGHEGLGYSINPGTDIFYQLDNYLESGGKLYLEGAAPWDQASSLWERFAILPMISGEPYNVHQIWGHGVEDDYIWDYGPADIGASFSPGDGGYVVFRSANQGNPIDPIGIYTDHISGSATLGCAFELKLLADNPSSYTDMVRLITQYLIGGPPMANDEEIPSPTLQLASYPNPFNPSATISFNLPRAGHTRLELYNIRGQRVKELINTDLPAGDHHMELRLEGTTDAALPSGIYLLRLRSGDLSQSLKMVLSK